MLLAFILVAAVFWSWKEATYANSLIKLGQFRRVGDIQLTQEQVHTLDSLRRIDRTIAGY